MMSDHALPAVVGAAQSSHRHHRMGLERDSEGEEGCSLAHTRAARIPTHTHTQTHMSPVQESSVPMLSSRPSGDMQHGVAGYKGACSAGEDRPHTHKGHKTLTCHGGSPVLLRVASHALCVESGTGCMRDHRPSPRSVGAGHDGSACTAQERRHTYTCTRVRTHPGSTSSRTRRWDRRPLNVTVCRVCARA